jgi:hypothetical protein
VASRSRFLEPFQIARVFGPLKKLLVFRNRTMTETALPFRVITSGCERTAFTRPRNISEKVHDGETRALRDVNTRRRRGAF